jgi:hypothetical protein
MKVGDTIFYTDRFKRGGAGLKETTIEKIGTKYIYLKATKDEKFDSSSLRHITPNLVCYTLYKTKEQYQAEIEEEILRECIYKKVHSFGHKISLDQLRRINAILNEPK